MIFIYGRKLLCASCEKPFIYYRPIRHKPSDSWLFKTTCECPWVIRSEEESECL